MLVARRDFWNVRLYSLFASASCLAAIVFFLFFLLLIFFCCMMHVSLLCLCEVASTDGLMPFLVACHCTVFIANVLFCYVLGK